MLILSDLLSKWFRLLLWLSYRYQRLLLLIWISYFFFLLDRIRLDSLNDGFCWSFERMMSCLVKLYFWFFRYLRDWLLFLLNNDDCCWFLWFIAIRLLNQNVLCDWHSFTLYDWFCFSHLILWKLLSFFLCCNCNLFFLYLLFCLCRVDDGHYWLIG